jgi:hypothetical protein
MLLVWKMMELEIIVLCEIAQSLVEMYGIFFCHLLSWRETKQSKKPRSWMLNKYW